MVTLVQGRTVKSAQATLAVEGLPVGRQRLQLVVVDGDGNSSQPDVVVVEITRGIVIEPPIVRDPQIPRDTPIPRPLPTPRPPLGARPRTPRRRSTP